MVNAFHILSVIMILIILVFVWVVGTRAILWLVKSMIEEGKRHIEDKRRYK